MVLAPHTSTNFYNFPISHGLKVMTSNHTGIAYGHTYATMLSVQ